MPKPIKKSRKINFYYLKHEFYGKALVTFFGLFLILLTLLLVVFIASKGFSTFTKDHVSPLQFLFSTLWKPDRDLQSGGPVVGALIFIIGSILISVIALIISTPFSIGTAVFMTEISPRLGKKLLQPAIEIFVGIPSVVYGWVGLSVLVPFIHRVFGGLGFSLLAGGIVLAVMIFPTITSVAADALRALPGDYKEASYALGSTRWQTIRKVLVPSALPGILTGVVLGLARAFGEALAVQMVIGNSIRIPGSLLDSTVNLTSIITMDMGNTVNGTVWNNSLWSMALLLLVISFLFIVLIHKIGSKGRVQR
ncbi:MAG: phosphate ABC transporter permease subunit PstC [Bacillota bacterium]|nr:phosphate ABC transporter permease subunit PstC [Bacillota bacterium]